MKNRSLRVLLFLLLPAAGDAGAQDEFDAAAVFGGQCAACHTVGRGDDVGPDLQDVTERRDRAWLVAFIQSSQSLVMSGDPTATELFERFQRQKMPDHPFSVEQIDEILAYIQAGGPRVTPRIRPAASASADEVRRGRELFFRRPEHGSSCASCHTVGAPGEAAFYLGGSLAHSFSKYRDVELARDLARKRKVCRRVVGEESFLLRAYLRHVDGRDGEPVVAAGLFPLFGLSVAALFLGLTRWRGIRQVPRKLSMQPGEVS